MGLHEDTLKLFDQWYDPQSFGAGKPKLYIRFIKAENRFCLKEMENEFMEETNNHWEKFFLGSVEITNKVIDMYDEDQDNLPLIYLSQLNVPVSNSFVKFREVEWSVSDIIHRKLIRGKFYYKIVWTSCHGQNFVG